MLIEVTLPTATNKNTAIWGEEMHRTFGHVRSFMMLDVDISDCQSFQDLSNIAQYKS